MIVAHSMGGLVARAYLRRHGGAQVARVITLGTPHHGTALANLAPGSNARQMSRPGGQPNAWLAQLAASETPQHARADHLDLFASRQYRRAAGLGAAARRAQYALMPAWAMWRWRRIRACCARCCQKSLSFPKSAQRLLRASLR